jgi:CHAT domain-containing protein
LQATYLDRLEKVEEQLQALLEQTTLLSSHRLSPQIMTIDMMQSVQESIDDDDVLLEFYTDGDQLWAFVITSTERFVTKLNSSMEEIESLLGKLQFNIECILKAKSNSAVSRHLKNIGDKLCHALYRALFSNCGNIISTAKRLYIIPYGSLHYVPFQALLSDESYLIKSHEIVILPFSNFLLQAPRRYSNRSTVLASDWNGRLNLSSREANTIASLIDADVFEDEKCTRDAIDGKSGAILHLATHSEFRLDKPDLSYIYLNDGHLFSTDLLQNRIRFELVVLSACETGRAHVTHGDDLVGVGHSFLYSGTDAVVASQWQVDEECTNELMESFYCHLIDGESKAAALRFAQLKFIDQYPDEHVAFWGAFQLLGNPDPILSFKKHNERNIHVR